MIYRLTAKHDWQHEEFYFKTKKKMKKFLEVFKNYGCNIIWNKPEELPDDYELDDYWEEHIDDNPKETAKDNLCWGFNSVIPEQRMTNEQNKEQDEFDEFVNQMVEQLG